MEVYNAVGGRWVDACSNDVMGWERRRRERRRIREIWFVKWFVSVAFNKICSPVATMNTSNFEVSYL